MTPQHERLVRARVKLFARVGCQEPAMWTFLSVLAGYLEIKEFPQSILDGLTVREITPTMATDGQHLFYANEFVDKCSDDELVALWSHEVLHPALIHLWRGKQYADSK